MGGRGISRAALLALAVYLVALALILLWPTPVDRLLPRSIWVVLWHARRAGLEWVTFSAVEITANVLLFVPFGLLMVLVLPARRWWLAPIPPLVVSCLAEIAQRILLPDRVPSLLDVLANTAGALLGVAVGVMIRRVRRDRTSARS